MSTQKYGQSYSDVNTVQRLTPDEEAFKYLRPPLGDLERYLESDAPPPRPSNNQALEMMDEEHLTDYDNEAPVVREHNDANMAGGNFWSSLGKGINTAVGAVGKVVDVGTKVLPIAMKLAPMVL